MISLFGKFKNGFHHQIPRLTTTMLLNCDIRKPANGFSKDTNTRRGRRHWTHSYGFMDVVRVCYALILVLSSKKKHSWERQNHSEVSVCWYVTRAIYSESAVRRSSKISSKNVASTRRWLWPTFITIFETPKSYLSEIFSVLSSSSYLGVVQRLQILWRSCMIVVETA